ncbi:MAG: toprim domain-containing protein [Roseburia sp.]|nr:toprim domain-containing protein [Roseburia sp.]MCM1278482.1 toprim domain-containing protein [Robinsoniella sp.]
MGFEYKDQLKELLPDYMELLEEQGKTENRGNDYWTCPFCDSGNKENRSAAFHIIGTKFQCFSCDAHGDIYDLVANMENLPDDWKKHYNRTLKIMRPYLNGGKPKKSREEYIPEFLKQIDYTDYLQKCHENVGQTDYFVNRGLSRETIDRFKLGYDAEKNVITIPYNTNCKGYVHRILWESDNKYCKFGNEIFNIEALYSESVEKLLFGRDDYVFVTEGQIDAMSFEEVELSAVGLGGVNETKKLVELLKQMPTEKIIVLALDNDNAGRRATGKFIEELAEAELDQKYIAISDLYGKYKDANEFLVADRKRFIERMNRITHK